MADGDIILKDGTVMSWDGRILSTPSIPTTAVPLAPTPAPSAMPSTSIPTTTVNQTGEINGYPTTVQQTAMNLQLHAPEPIRHRAAPYQPMQFPSTFLPGIGQMEGPVMPQRPAPLNGSVQADAPQILGYNRNQLTAQGIVQDPNAGGGIMTDAMPPVAPSPVDYQPQAPQYGNYVPQPPPGLRDPGNYTRPMPPMIPMRGQYGQNVESEYKRYLDDQMARNDGLLQGQAVDSYIKSHPQPIPYGQVNPQASGKQRLAQWFQGVGQAVAGPRTQMYRAQNYAAAQQAWARGLQEAQQEQQQAATRQAQLIAEYGRMLRDQHDMLTNQQGQVTAANYKAIVDEFMTRAPYPYSQEHPERLQEIQAAERMTGFNFHGYLYMPNQKGIDEREKAVVMQEKRVIDLIKQRATLDAEIAMKNLRLESIKRKEAWAKEDRELDKQIKQQRLANAQQTNKIRNENQAYNRKHRTEMDKKREEDAKKGQMKTLTDLLMKRKSGVMNVLNAYKDMMNPLTHPEFSGPEGEAARNQALTDAFGPLNPKTGVPQLVGEGLKFLSEEFPQEMQKIEQEVKGIGAAPQTPVNAPPVSITSEREQFKNHYKFYPDSPEAAIAAKDDPALQRDIQLYKDATKQIVEQKAPPALKIKPWGGAPSSEKIVGQKFLKAHTPLQGGVIDNSFQPTPLQGGVIDNQGGLSSAQQPNPPLTDITIERRRNPHNARLEPPIRRKAMLPQDVNVTGATAGSVVSGGLAGPINEDQAHPGTDAAMDFLHGTFGPDGFAASAKSSEFLDKYDLNSPGVREVFGDDIERWEKLKRMQKLVKITVDSLRRTRGGGNVR